MMMGDAQDLDLGLAAWIGRQGVAIPLPGRFRQGLHLNAQRLFFAATVGKGGRALEQRVGQQCEEG